jgi:hypothetical protein
MSAILIALISLLVAISLGTLLLYKQERPLKARAQAFKFHELRDKLQLLAIEGKIDKTSRAYEFLQFTINLAIKNAGVMRLTELLGLTKAINRRMNTPTATEVISEIRRHDQQVQQLSAEVFASISEMLISNDRIIYLLAKALELSAKDTAPRIFKNTARIFMPAHSEALHAALNYRNWGNSLNLQLHHTNS